MEKNNTSDFETAKSYPPEIGFIGEGLIIIADRDRQFNYWLNCGYCESSLSFDAEVDFFKDVVRSREASLRQDQITAILRVHVMCRRFERILDAEPVPEDWTEKHLYMINHPYWIKVQKQAVYALSLLKDDGIERVSTNKESVRYYESIKQRTADRSPKLDRRFGDKIRVFGDYVVRSEQWKTPDDFWSSVNSYDLVAKKFFDGLGMLSSGKHLRGFMAFHEALDKLCAPYENDGGRDLGAILSDPRFYEVEKTAQDFLKLIEPGDGKQIGKP